MSYDFETSRPAYEEAKVSSDLKRQIVFKAIRTLGVCTDSDIQKYLGWGINKITPRRGELVARGLVESAYKKEGPEGRKVNYWKIVPVLPKQANLFQ